jgi:hypothetical protein
MSDSRRALLAISVLLLTAACLSAQTDRGTIRGTVTDQSGAVVPGALVTATSSATGVHSAAKSTDAGIYSIAALPAGAYTVEVQGSGFKTLTRQNVAVDVGDVTGLDLTLEVGNALQTVNVDAAAPILKTEQSSTSTEVSVEAFSDLPLSAGGGRSPQSFINLTPGVNSSTVNGSQQNSAAVSMDGLSVQNAENIGATNNVRFPPEAVSEMSILTTAYSAEYGQTGGGVQRYEIKSGTNQYHGNLYEYFKNTALDARGFFNVRRPVDRQNEYGFSIGGPVSIPKLYNGRNRSFFFFDADWFKTLGASATHIVSLPNAAFRSGDFSGNLGNGVAGATNPCTGGAVLSGQIFDPATTQTVNGQQCRNPFPGNIIPANRISPVSQKLLAMLPSSTTQALLTNTNLFAQPSFNNFNDYIIKGDQYFGSKHHLTMSYLNSTNPTGGGSLLPAPLATAGVTYYSWDFSRLTYDWIVSPTLLNTLQLGYQREIFEHQPTGSYGESNWDAQLGIPNYQSASGLFPAILWGSYQTLGNQQFWYATSNTYLLSDSFSWATGRHSFKFGVQYDDELHALWKDWPAQFSFSQNETGLPNNFGSTGNVVASFLLGAVDSTNIPSLANTSVNYRVPVTLDLYAQDDYKLSKRVTINYGVRWSLFMPMTEEHNIYSAVDLAKPNPAAGNLPGSYVFAGLNGQGSCLSSACATANGWSPRLGIAWRATNRVVVRSAYGISYYPTGLYGAGNNAYLTDGFDPTSTSTTPDNGVTPATTFNQGFPLSQLQTRNLTSSYAIGSTFDYWSNSAQKIANIQSWNVTVQTRLAQNLALDVAYVGTKGTHLTLPANINQLSDSYLGLGATLLDSNINSPTVTAAGFTPPWPGFATALGANATLAQALRPYPQYLTGFGYNSDNLGDSTYHALQAKLEKRLSNGLYLLASYTWDKSITDANTTLLSTPGNNPSGSGVVRDWYNLSLSKSVASAWVPMILTTAFTYELPVGLGKRFLNKGGLAGRIIGGWHLNGILTYQSGGLIGVLAQQGLPSFAGPNYATTVQGTPQMGTWSGSFNPAADRYLNVHAFAAPIGYGTGGQYLPNLRGPASRNENLSVSKLVPIREKMNFELRLETFNTFNRVVFGNPAANIATPQNFGQITTQGNSPRNAQIAAKLNF